MNSQRGKFRYILTLLLFFILKNAVYAIDLKFRGLVDGYSVSWEFNDTEHCGIDKQSGINNNVLSTNFGEKEQSVHRYSNLQPCSVAICSDNAQCGNDIVVGGDTKNTNDDVTRFKNMNYALVKHLLSDGSYLWSRYLHMSPQVSQTDIDILEKYKFIAQGQLLGQEGRSGKTCSDKNSEDAGVHLHYEVDTKIGKNLGAVITTNITTCASGKTIAVDPSPYFGTANDRASILLPLISRTEEAPTIDKYDVYGVANTNIYGSLDINSTNINTSAPLLTNARIAVYNSRNRANVSNVSNDLFSSNKFPGVITGSNKYNAGDYLFVPAVTDAAGERTGYPVKFSILANENDRIVDNDQRENDANRSTYEITGQPGLNVPGYFLTATLHKGKSGDTAQWCPNVTGNYNVFVHIPEYGATATNVVYSMGDTNFNSIDQTKTGGEWVQLTSSNKAFSFNTNDCIKLDLSDSKNPNVTATQLAAFDAIKFEYVAENGGGKESETKLSIGYEKNARKQMVGDKVNISCYFKPSDEKNKVSYSIEVNNKVIPVVGKISATEPFILSATYEIPADKEEITIDCIADKKKVTEKISNIGSYSEPKNEHDIKEGDRITVQSDSVDVYNCVNEGDFYSTKLIGKVSLGSQGHADKVFFDKDGKKWRGIKLNTGVQISADNPCVAEDSLTSFDNPCFFDDFKGKIVSAKQDVNCRKRLANGKIDMENNPVKIILGTLGFSIENDSFSSDSYTWRGVSWYNEAGDHCYSAENYLNLTNFDDTPYFESVGEMCKMGVVDGYGNHKFGPHNTFSRAEITKVMINLLPILKENKVEGLPEFPEKEGEKIINYEDVAKEEYKDRLCIDDKGKPCWYYSYVGKATKAGIVEGYNDNEFKYNRNISHPELAKMVINSIVFDSKTAPSGVTRANWYLSESFQSDDIGKKCNFTTIDGKERLAWDCYNKNSQGNEEVWPDSNHWYCAYIYQSVGITTPIYDPGRASFIDITKDKVEKDTLRAEAMQSFYNAYLFRLKNKTYSLLNCENKN